MRSGTWKDGWVQRADGFGPRLHVRLGAAGLLVREAPLVAAWALLWLAFPLAIWTSIWR